MAVSSDALYFLLTEDLSKFLERDQYISALLKGDIPLYPDSKRENVAAVLLLRNVFKKLVTTVEPNANARALDKFTQSNDLCERWNWSRQDWTLRDDILVGTFKQVIHRVFSDRRLCFDDLTSLTEGALGHGANIHAVGTDVYSKLYASRLSSSNPAIFDLYQRYVATNDRWRSAEFIRTLHFGHGADVCDSKLSFVPKSNVISRTICTEPTLNMWFQRAYSSRLEAVLQTYFSVDLSWQPDANRELARLGSRDDSFATIDLESASDSISLKLLKDVLPSSVYNILKFLRSGYTLLPNQERYELQMVSSMGNGFTFSLQTLIFCCMVEAVYEVYGLASHRPKRRGQALSVGNYGVFGDDIIVEKRAYAPLHRLLTLSGFRVNATKSFSEGPFRESCGADFLNGANVRAVYIKDLQTLNSRYAALNLLRYWSSRTQLDISRAVRFLARTVRYLPVPRSAPIDSGIHVPLASVTPTRTVFGSCAVLHYSPLDVRIKVIGERVVTPRFAKKRIFNPDGLLLYALSGGLRGGSFSIRVTNLKYRLRCSVFPYWDAPPVGPDPLDPAGWVRWESESLVLSQYLKP